MKSGNYILGFDVGGTKIAIGLVSRDGKLIGRDRIDNKNTEPDDILPQLLVSARKLLKEAGLAMDDVAAFGVSAVFPADAFNGIITAPTNNKKWRYVPIKQYLTENLGIEGHFENDANCGALAEMYFGAGRGVKDFIYLTMSTGIGGGIISDGKLVRGKLRYAGEIGHMVVELDGRQCNCGQKGCYEAYAGGRAIAMRLQEELKDRPDHPIVKFAGGKLKDIDMIALEKAVRINDPYALKIWDEMSLRNAQAMGSLINIFNPQRIILGTLAWAVGDLYLDPIRKYLPRFAWKNLIECCEIVPSELERDLGYYSGPAAALYYLNEKEAAIRL